MSVVTIPALDIEMVYCSSFVYRRLVCIVHLVKLVDQEVTLVGEYERTTLERPFARDRVLVHARHQADRGHALVSRENGFASSLLDGT
jgi:hypothetical protein